MAPQLGKRKRISREELEQPSRSPTPSSASSESDQEDGSDIRDIFRRAFEAKFKALPDEPKKKQKKIPVVEKQQELEEDDESDEESDWSGLSSSSDENGGVEIIEHTSTQRTSTLAAKSEYKAFMSSKPPSSTPSQTPASKNTSTKEPTDPLESTHLKNDLALQKLLRDSHLLNKTPSILSTSESKSTPTTLSATGALRHKSTDLHLLSLGAKTSIHAQKSMPMSHRKGITAKAKQREEKRRAEAQANGIILEREVKVKKFERERERGIGGPAVGKFKGGMLTLSKRDVEGITGSGGSRGRGGGRGGRGGKRGKR